MLATWSNSTKQLDYQHEFKCFNTVSIPLTSTCHRHVPKALLDPKTNIHFVWPFLSSIQYNQRTITFQSHSHTHTYNTPLSLYLYLFQREKQTKPRERNNLYTHSNNNNNNPYTSPSIRIYPVHKSNQINSHTHIHAHRLFVYSFVVVNQGFLLILLNQFVFIIIIDMC